MEDKKHKEIMDALAEIKADDERYLRKKPYADMLAPFRYFYEHPKMALLAFFVFVDVFMDLQSKGFITFLLTLIFK